MNQSRGIGAPIAPLVGVPLFPGHPGKIGDGTVFQTCGTCNGTQKIGSMPMSEEEANEITEELEESGGFTEGPLNQSQVRHAGEILEKAIREAHAENAAKEEQEAQEEEQPLTPDILCFEGSAWTFENKRVREATDDDMRGASCCCSWYRRGLSKQNDEGRTYRPAQPYPQ